MYPNPQDVLPLPPHPSQEHYRKLAKDLVKACKSSEADVAAWSARWLRSLSTRLEPDELDDAAIAAQSATMAGYAIQRLGDACQLSEAQFAIARMHGFESWPRLIAHCRDLARDDSTTGTFERAADAIIGGRLDELQHLLETQPALIRARSMREHRATLLHYVSANGVENYRQRTPRNIVAITRTLLEAGAEVDARADMYGGGATTLGLVATSAHPRALGLQNDLIDVLLEFGARLDLEGAGNRHSMVHGCLANGCPEAAAHLARHGAPLDVAGAAGACMTAELEQMLSRDGLPSARQVHDAMSYASWYGCVGALEILLRHGVDINTQLHVFGSGRTALHVAANNGQVGVVQFLLARGADVNVLDEKWSATPLDWALDGMKNKPRAAFDELVAVLKAAGAKASL